MYSFLRYADQVPGLPNYFQLPCFVGEILCNEAKTEILECSEHGRWGKKEACAPQYALLLFFLFRLFIVVCEVAIDVHLLSGVHHASLSALLAAFGAVSLTVCG